MRRALIAVLLVLGVLASATIASAASLAVRPGTLTSLSRSHPCLGASPVVVVPASPTGAANTYTAVRTTLAPGCEGATVRLALTSPTGTVAQFQGTVVGGSVTAPITTAASYVVAAGYAVQAVVSGWGLRATWQATVQPTGQPIVPGNGVTVVASVAASAATPPAVCFRVTVAVASTVTGGGAIWGADLNTAASPWNGALTGYTASGAAAVTMSAPDAAGIIHIKGGNGAPEKLKYGESVVFTVCNTNPPPA